MGEVNESRSPSVPSDVLRAWTALEVLSPQSFNRPDDLGGSGDVVVMLDRETLPWKDSPRPEDVRKTYFYRVVLGCILLDRAAQEILRRFGDTRPERPGLRPRAVLASATLDADGRLLPPPALTVSSLGWGLPRAISGDLATLADWSVEAPSIIGGLDDRLRLRRTGPSDLPLDRETLDGAFCWLGEELDLPNDLVEPPLYALRSERSAGSGAPDPLLLNSFILDDLAEARERFRTGRAPTNLRRYLGAIAPDTRVDLLADVLALEETLAPARIPPARWPSPGRYPLNLLQQAAVNAITTSLHDEGLIGVNGPPGTGKTTILRDLLAHVITERAEAMLDFDDPRHAFTRPTERVDLASGYFFDLHPLDERLTGFEVVVASSNNAAVENISAVLPVASAIADDADRLRYFPSISDGVVGESTWGMAAAVLGNRSNRRTFIKAFWEDQDRGLRSYLREMSNTPVRIVERDLLSGNEVIRVPRVVTLEGPPADPADALARWNDARKRFKTALRRARASLASLEDLRQQVRSIGALRAELDQARIDHEGCSALAASARDRRDLAAAEADVSRARLDRETVALAASDASSPGMIARRLPTNARSAWRRARAPALGRLRTARGIHAERVAARSTSDAELRLASVRLDTAARNLAAAERAHSQAQALVDKAQASRPEHLVDGTLLGRLDPDRLRSTAWLGAAEQHLRDEVFVAAMALHRAFIDGSATQIRHNLGALFDRLGGATFPRPGQQALMPDLWATFFLVVPLVSTTFASVRSMFGDLPAESIGWLFVDEAGQAAPQQAVGAILRTRRAVVVGDPLQIEPIVTLPPALTHAICDQFGVEPGTFNAPGASVQTLADRASPYVARFPTADGGREVGAPLLVHRRSIEPMFGIANVVAYEGMMVQATPERPSRIGEVLGPSAWFDVRGSSHEKWGPEEGDCVLELLLALQRAAVEPDLYVITPFRIVQDRLRECVSGNTSLADWLEPRWARRHIGTLHTVQGREAEAVILVLGAPAADQSGARHWAGRKPNLLNVAVTRARDRLYVVGNRSLWHDCGVFGELHRRIDNEADDLQ